MKHYHHLALLVGSLMMLTSCEKSLEVAGAAEGNSMLTVQTRADESSAKVSYPVTVYAMNGDGQCVRRQQLLSDNDQLSMNLEPMTYQIYAIGGATEGDYTLPTQENATATSAVTLNSEATHGDLMTAHNTINLSDNESTTLTLTMSRKVMHLQSLVIENVPTTVDGVAVAFTPIYDQLLLNGDYSTTSSEQSVTLTEQEDGTTWQITDDELYMLPASDDATITVKFTTGSDIQSFAYTCPQPLEANKHICIKGTYNESNELTLTGTITGATWDGTTTIEFTFNSKGSSTVNDDNSGSGNNNSGNQNNVVVEEGEAPSAGSVYKDCYVLNIEDDNTGEYVIATLLYKLDLQIQGSQYDTQQDLESEINTSLSTFDTNNITGWRLPTESEMSSIAIGVVNKAFKDASVSGATDMGAYHYYYSDGANIKCALLTQNIYDRSYTYGERLRPVTTVMFAK